MAQDTNTPTKKELELQIERQREQKKKDREKQSEFMGHVTRFGLRKGGFVVGSTVLVVSKKLLPPNWSKYLNLGASLITQGLGIGADAFGHEGAAGLADTTSGTLLGAYLEKVVAGKAPKDSDKDGYPDHADKAPNDPAAHGVAGEMWASNTLLNTGAVANPSKGDRLRRPVALRRSPEAPVHGSSALPQRPVGPIGWLVANRPAFRLAVRRGMATHGFDNDDENVMALAAAADSSATGEVIADAETGEFVELIDRRLTTGAMPGPVGAMASAIAALRALVPLMARMDQEGADVPAKPATGEVLSDEELALAATAGVLDPEDVHHVMTSGFDDGVYVSGLGNELTADQVRAEFQTLDAAGISDRWEAFKARRQAKKQAREKREQLRLKSKASRTKAKEAAKTAKLQQKLERKEGSAERKEAYATNRAESEAAHQDQQLASVEQQGATLSSSSSSSTAAPASAEPTITDDEWQAWQ